MQKTIVTCLVEFEHLPLVGAFTIKGTKVVVKCNVILYHVYFEKQVCVLYLFKLLFFLQLYLFVYDFDLPWI
jgi:hypothetical protein